MNFAREINVRKDLGEGMKIFSEDELREFLESQEELVIYGTGGMGGNLHRFLQRHNWLDKLKFFLVTENTQAEFEGVPVKGIHDLLDSEKSVPVMIATRQNFHEDIIHNLEGEKIWDYHTMSEEVLNLIERLALEMPEGVASFEKAEATPKRKESRKATGRGIQTITKLNDYLDELKLHAKELLILIAARDTLGLELKTEANKRLMALGTQNLLRKHWRGYVYASYLGEVLADEMGKADESAKVSLEVEGLAIELESHPLHDGDKAVLSVGGHDYAMNIRGLNIVVLDLARNQLVDSVSFDTHAAKLPCTRSELYVLPKAQKRASLKTAESRFVDEALPKYLYEAGAKRLQRSIFQTEDKPLEEVLRESDTEEERLAAFFAAMCRQEGPVVLPEDKIAFFSSLEDIPVEKMARGMARRRGLPVGETCRLAENVCLDFHSVLTKGLVEMPEAKSWREALLELAARYAEEAGKVGNKVVAASFRQVPAHHARNLTEALQCVRFLLGALHLAGHKGTVLGRPDQYLYGYWQRDLEKGRLTEQDAGELFCAFLASLARSGVVPVLTMGAGNSMTRNIIEMAVSKELPPMILALRVAADTPQELLELAGKCQGIYQLQDSEILPELAKIGIADEMAKEYVLSAGGEIVLPGYVRQGRLDGAVSFVKAVKEAKQGLHEEMELAEAEEVLRDEVRAQVLGMLAYQTVHFLSSPLLELLSVKVEKARNGRSHIYVPYGEVEKAAYSWMKFLRKEKISGAEELGKDEICSFFKDSLAEACERYSMFDKVFRLEPRMREVSHE